ncbi:MAG: ATP synthase F1 subunit delta [Planctomycetota bacterium]
MTRADGGGGSGRHTAIEARNATICDAYAEALLPLARGAGMMNVVLDELAGMASLFLASDDIAAWFAGPLVSTEAKMAVLERACRDRLSDLTCDALGVIARHERLGELAGIAEAFRLRVYDVRGQAEVHVTSAVPLSDAILAKVREAVRHRLDVDPVLVEHVDPAILGGLVVRRDDEVIDVSTRNELRQIQQTIARWVDTMVARPRGAAATEAASE